MLWWSDFPYLLRTEPRPRAAFPGAEPINIVLDSDVRARKREACRAYASQIGFQFGGPERLDQQLAGSGSERFLGQDLTEAVRSALVSAEAAA